MQKYLVTGGAGFIGGNLVEHLVKKGKDVVVYDNLWSGKLDNIKNIMSSIEFIKGDINDRSLLEKTIKKYLPDVVVHLAAKAFIPYCNDHPEETLTVNVNGTLQLLNICSKHIPQKILFASSAAVYPPSSPAYSETHMLKPFDIYGLSKICGEHLMELFSKKIKCSIICCRLFCTYGPKSTIEFVIPHILNQIKEGKDLIELGNIKPKRDFIYVIDVVDALVRLSQTKQKRFDIYNIGTGIEHSVEELVKIISKILNKDINISSVNKFKRNIDRPHLLANINKIRRNLRWKPKFDISKGLSELIKIELI